MISVSAGAPGFPILALLVGLSGSFELFSHAPAPAASSGVPAVTSECYRVVEAGPWSPRPREAEGPFLSIPRTLRFEGGVGVDGPETGRKLVRPRQALGSRVGWAYRVQSIEPFDMQIVFVNEVMTIHLNLYERSWGWIGDAVARAGAGALYRRRVRLEGISCEVEPREGSSRNSQGTRTRFSASSLP